MVRTRNGWIGLAVTLLSLPGLAGAARAQDGGGSSNRIEHLLQAAAHLEKAGRQDMAAEIYSQVEKEAEADRQRLVAARLEQIRQLESEVVRLRMPAAVRNQILVEVKLVEVSMAKARQVGLSLVSIQNLLDSSGTPAILDEDGQIGEFIELLGKEGLVQVLAEPKLVTVSGRPAILEIGNSSAPVPQGLSASAARPARSPRRLRFACTPSITADGRIAIDIDLGGQWGANPRTQVAANAPPAGDARSLEIKTQVEVRSGDTLILVGQPRAADSEANSLLMLLTAKTMGVLDQQQAP